ncbi:MAG: hypothetical protein COB65_14265 [Thalassobium sp.]|nr:MAG: hypothetical protein COB65_14265 [Thalassobium sp.]
MYKYERLKQKNTYYTKVSLNDDGQIKKKTLYSITGKKLFKYQYEYQDGKITYKRVKCAYRNYKGEFYYTDGVIQYMTFGLKSYGNNISLVISGVRQYQDGVLTDTKVNKKRYKSTPPPPRPVTIVSPVRQSFNNEQRAKEGLRLYKGKYTSVKYSYDSSNRIDKITYLMNYSTAAYVRFSYNSDGTLEKARLTQY